MTFEKRQSFLASADRTASGQGDGVRLDQALDIIAFLAVTAHSGTPQLDVWLQGSANNVTWFDLGVEYSLATNASATDQAQTRSKRNINPAQITTEGQWTALVKLPCDWVRPVWVIGGGSPHITFSIDIVGK